MKHQIGQVNYEIIMNSQGKTKIFHINLLKKWFTRTAEQYSYLSDIEDGSITGRGNLTQEIKIGKKLTKVQQAELISHHIPTKDCVPIRPRPYIPNTTCLPRRSNVGDK